MTNDCMLTTYDNPFNPFEQFTLWLLFDKEKGYNTCEYLARIMQTSDDLSEKEFEDEAERAMDEIIKYDPFNIYRKVTNNSVEVAAESADNPT